MSLPVSVCLIVRNEERNFATSLASQPHIFVLDADERLVAESVPGVGSYRAAFNLDVFHESLGDGALARRYFEQAASARYLPAIERLRDGRRSSAAFGTSATPIARAA